MDAQRWERINSIFLAALQRDAPERAAFVEGECGADADLAVEVFQMLAGDAAAGDSDDEFLKAAPLNVKSHFAPDGKSDPLIGQRIGPFEIVRRVGSGGMGIVYLGTRSQPFKQRVAIKILKRGMDTDEILRRFRNEIRVCAALGKHPHIAGLLDAGAMADGLPYFVMDFVEGEQLTRHCDREKLTVEQRLQLFQTICGAVQFAHQHMVIHRDLKPSNILVTPDGNPKLIDFGIAKLTAPELGGNTAIPTRTQMRALTPDYASPEQVRGDPVTAATDVFSLGVVLYELLTGHRPYSIDGIGPQRMERAFEEQEAEKPSTVVARPTSQDDTTKIADARGTQQRQLHRRLTGDLDNIVLKAVRKEPSRRYTSAEQLSRDIQRHLSGEPVEARPIGRVERTWRICRRNPLAASLFLSVLVGFTIGVWQLSRVTRQVVESTALHGAAQQARLIEKVHEAYSAESMRVGMQDRNASELLKRPAVFTRELAEQLGKADAISDAYNSIMYARLYSRYRFRSSSELEFPKTEMDEFEAAALEHVERHRNEPYYQFLDEYQGRAVLRYVQARIMEQQCVGCHNADMNSPKRDWVVDDVGGAIEIIRPLDGDIDRAQDELRGTFVLMAVVTASVLCVGCVVLLLGNRVTGA